MNNHDSDIAALHTKRIARLRDQAIPLDPQDPMPEAGRKVLLRQFIRMLEREAGSRSGQDIEDVHKMRVSIRHMRSAFRLLAGFYRPKRIAAFDADLRRVMRALGRVRDLDVMIHDLTQFHASLEVVEAAILQEVLDVLDQRRDVARARLVETFDSKAYRRFIKRFSKFLTTPEAGAVRPSGVVPFQVRHVLPPMIYARLADVRAYEPLLDEADEITLHNLRIEFKRLRYTVALFADLLGAQAADYISELKAMQDHLGRLNDISVAQARFRALMEDLEGHQSSVLWLYIDHLEAEKAAMQGHLPDAWRRFASKSVQRRLASAVTAL
jgi:CHAD domain-containing protein